MSESARPVDWKTAYKLGSLQFGQRIKDARIGAGLTQIELATKVGTTQARISIYESGKEIPSQPRLKQIGEACGFDATKFVLEAFEANESIVGVLREEKFDDGQDFAKAKRLCEDQGYMVVRRDELHASQATSVKQEDELTEFELWKEFRRLKASRRSDGSTGFYPRATQVNKPRTLSLTSHAQGQARAARAIAQ